MIRRFLRSLGTGLLIAGVILILDAALTVIWQEPFSYAYSAVIQGGLDEDLAQLGNEGPAAAEREALAALAARDQKIAYLARSLRRRVPSGSPIARVSIPKLDVTKPVINGTSTGDLRKGPGLIESTDLPGLGGTTAIAGHRTTYGAPFNAVDDLRAGDRIILTLPYGRFDYRVERTQIVKPDALWVLDRVGRERLVLSACHPLHSAAERIIVFARFDRYRPPESGDWADALSAAGAHGLSASPRVG